MLNRLLLKHLVAWLKDVLSNVTDSADLDLSLQVLREEAQKESPDLRRASAACQKILRSEDELDMLLHFQSIDRVMPAMRAVEEYHLMRATYDTLACVGGKGSLIDVPALVLERLAEHPITDAESAEEWASFVEVLDEVSHDLKLLLKNRAPEIHQEYFEGRK